MKKQPFLQLIDELAEWCGKRPLRLWHLYCDSLPFRRAARRKLHQFVKGFAERSR